MRRGTTPGWQCLGRMRRRRAGGGCELPVGVEDPMCRESQSRIVLNGNFALGVKL